MTQIYARIENGKVTNIILAEADFIESGAVGDPSKWIDTTDHKNKPGVGSLHHAELNGFVHTKPYPNWVFDDTTCEWIPPVSKPDGDWFWDQHADKWIQYPS
jgi:hypothetical protein